MQESLLFLALLNWKIYLGITGWICIYLWDVANMIQYTEFLAWISVSKDHNCADMSLMAMVKH